MQLTLTLIRHGEAHPAVGDGDEADFVRPLTDHGIKESKQTAVALHKASLRVPFVLPLLVLVSEAKRAEETAQELLAGWEQKNFEQKVLRPLYMARPKSICQQLVQFGDQSVRRSIIVVAHNPGLSRLVSDLTGEARTLRTAEMVTMAIEAESWATALELQGAWAELGE